MSKLTVKQVLRPLFLFAFFVFFFSLGTGQVRLFDWDEVNFAEAAREMLATQDFLQVKINFLPFIEKPPFFFWLQSFSMALFGVSDFAARFPNALCGAITLFVLMGVGRKFGTKRFSYLWVLVYVGSLLPHFYFKSGIIDPWFNLFIFLGIYFLWVWNQDRRVLFSAALAGISAGLAVLTKGPVGVFMVGLVGAIYLFPWKWRGLWQGLLLFAGAVLVMDLGWYAKDFATNGQGFVWEFFEYQIRLLKTQDAGHGGPFYYHFVVLLLGCFPASAFLFLKRPSRICFFETKTPKDSFRWLMWIFLASVLVVFSIVKTKIVHYSSLAYFPITYLAAERIEELWERRNRVSLPVLVLLGVLLTLVAATAGFLPFVGSHPELVLPYIRDGFAKAALLGVQPWGGWEWGIALPFLIAVFYSLWSLRKPPLFGRGIVVLFISTALFVCAFYAIDLPKIEKYTQGPAIDFFEAHQNEQALVHVYGFKSYAHLFYSRRPAEFGGTKYRELSPFRPVPVPVYWVSKVTRAHELEALPTLKRLGTRGGYSFFLQQPVR